METIDLEKIAHGSFVTDEETIFTVWAPHAKAVHVFGSFNDWNEDSHPLEAVENGCWSAFIPEAKIGDEYKYCITTADDQKLHKNDPYARILTNSSGNSIVYKDQFDWQGVEFEMPPMNQLKIYEMHIGTYHRTDENGPGTFATAIEKLDHLKNMGINCVEIMPVNEFAGDWSWGYNPAFPYAIESAYGGPDGFKNFVKACHERGIGVILDVVYNHFGPSDLDLWQFDGWSENGKGGIYFYNDWKSTTPWGDTRPDYGRNEVRQYIHDNAMMWLDEYRCDGLRMDMVPYIRNVYGDESEGNNIEEGFSLLRWINDEIHERWPEKITIAEDLHGNNFITDGTDVGGCAFSAQWDADFVHPVRAILTNGRDEDIDMQAVVDSLSKVYSNDAFRRVIYTESHDEVANGQARITTEVDDQNPHSYYAVRKSVLGMVLTLTAAGMPMLFQGQEMLEDQWFDDQDPLDWELAEKNSGIIQMVSDLCHLRESEKYPGLFGAHTKFILVDQEKKILGIQRSHLEDLSEGVMIFYNFSSGTYENYSIFPDPPLVAECIFNSSQEAYHVELTPQLDGFYFEQQEDNGSYSITTHFNPLSAKLFSYKHN